MFCVDASIHGLEYYIKMSKERRISDAVDSIDNRSIKREINKTRKQMGRKINVLIAHTTN